MTNLKVRFLTAVFLLLVPLLAAAAEPPAAQPAAQPQTPAEILKHANELLMTSKLSEAEAEFHRAETLSGGSCGECALGLATARASEGKWSESADLIQRSLPLLTAPALLSRAYNQLGMAYVKSGGAGNLAKAEEAMRRAVDYGGSWGDIARVNLAQVLFLEQRWTDAVPAAREALEKTAADPDMAKASRIILCQARSHLPDELPMQKGEAPPLRIGGEISRPEKIGGPAPVYTEEARKGKIHGVVIVESIIDTEGCVRQVKVLQGLPEGLSEAAVDAIRLWVFSPARQQDKPVTVFYTITVNFRVEPPKLALPQR